MIKQGNDRAQRTGNVTNQLWNANAFREKNANHYELSLTRME